MMATMTITVRDMRLMNALRGIPFPFPECPSYTMESDHRDAVVASRLIRVMDGRAIWAHLFSAVSILKVIGTRLAGVITLGQAPRCASCRAFVSNSASVKQRQTDYDTMSGSR
jgi:hypothetical protein